MLDTSTPGAPVLRITEIELCAWIGQAEPGEMLEYHRGFLVVDVDTRSTRLAGHERTELVHVAHRAWQAAENHLVHLVQQRRGACEFSYLAIARSRPQQISKSLSSLLLKEAA
jgi:hypothetical protein